MSSLAMQPRDFRRRVIDIDPVGDPRWVNLVMNHPDGQVYHHPAWLEAIHREYGRDLIGLACEDETGRLMGVLPLLPTRGLPFGVGGEIARRRLSSLPRTPTAGPLAIDQEACVALVRAAIDRARAEPGVLLQLKVATPPPDSIAELVACHAGRESYALDLDHADNPPRTDGRSRRRNAWAVNKARRSGVVVRQAETEAQLRSWYRLYLGTMRGLAVPARSYRFFQAVWQLLRPAGLMRLLIAEQRSKTGSKPIAGSIFLTFGSTVSYAFTGWDRASHSLRANDLIHAEMIEAARREGYRLYDFGEVADGQQSLAAFKGKWGAQPRQLYHCVYPPQPHDTASGLASGRFAGLAAAIWRRVPLGVTARLGDIGYGFL